MTPVAASFSGHENKSYMVASCEKRHLDDVPDEVFCSSCGWKSDWSYTRESFSLKTRTLDVSCTYDGACIVSSKAKEVLSDFADGVFRTLPNEPGFFHLVPVDIVEFDSERRKTRFGEICETCGLPHWVAGATPAYLKSLAGPDKHLFRTDILFGSYNEHHPLKIVSADLLRALEGADLKGLVLKPIGAEQVGADQPTAAVDLKSE